jgi:hypothetical protein
MTWFGPAVDAAMDARAAGLLRGRMTIWSVLLAEFTTWQGGHQ